MVVSSCSQYNIAILDKTNIMPASSIEGLILVMFVALFQTQMLLVNIILKVDDLFPKCPQMTT